MSTILDDLAAAAKDVGADNWPRWLPVPEPEDMCTGVSVNRGQCCARGYIVMALRPSMRALAVSAYVRAYFGDRDLPQCEYSVVHIHDLECKTDAERARAIRKMLVALGYDA